MMNMPKNMELKRGESIDPVSKILTTDMGSRYSLGLRKPIKDAEGRSVSN